VVFELAVEGLYSEPKMICMVLISCCWLVTIEWAIATAGGF
jgi:hypothetical protein